jgi:hypothetical protein
LSVVFEPGGSSATYLSDSGSGDFAKPQSLALAPGVGVIYLAREAGAMALGYELLTVQMRIHGMNESQPLLVGSSVTMTVVTTGASGGQTYLWAREDGRPLPNASNAPSYMFTPLTKDGTVGGSGHFLHGY